MRVRGQASRKKKPLMSRPGSGPRQPTPWWIPLAGLPGGLVYLAVNAALGGSWESGALGAGAFAFVFGLGTYVARRVWRK